MEEMGVLDGWRHPACTMPAILFRLISGMAIPLAMTIQARICCRCDEEQPCYGRISWMVSLGSGAAD